MTGYQQAALVHKIQALVDMNQNVVDGLIDPEGSTAAYKAYEDTVATSDSEEFDVLTDLGRYGRGGSITNGGSGSLLVSWQSYGFTSYGDTITILSGETFSLNVFIPFEKIKLTNESALTTADYRILVF